MAAAETTEVFDCTPEQFWNLISDFPKYPQFIGEVKGCKVLQQKDQQKLVEFEVSVIKSFTYRMWVTETAPTKMTWTLESGDLFKTSSGGWELQDQGGKTKARYFVDATFKVFVPGPVAKALVSVNLPNMMRAYHQRVKQNYK